MQEINRKKKNIVLDFDGTLLDSRKRHIVVLTDCINKVNKTQFSCNDFNKFVSFKADGKNGLMYLANKQILNAKNVIHLWIKTIEYRKYLSLDTLYSDTIPALEMLQKNYNLFLLTVRSKKENALWQIERLNIKKYFCDISVVNNKGNTAENKYNAIKHIPISYVIGDTEVDFELAKLLTCKFFALNNGFRNALFWKEQKINSYENLINIIIYNSL